MDDDILKSMRDDNRENYHKLWMKAKDNDYEGVTGEEKTIMKIMLEHEEEYSEIFANADSLGDYEFDPETGHNPFIHIVMHSVVENRLYVS